MHTVVTASALALSPLTRRHVVPTVHSGSSVGNGPPMVSAPAPTVEEVVSHRTDCMFQISCILKNEKNINVCALF